MPLKEKVPVIVEEHTKCKCDCRIKEHDCKRNQVYVKSQCKCECTNVDDYNKCLSVMVIAYFYIFVCFFELNFCYRKHLKFGTRMIALVDVEIQGNVRLERTMMKTHVDALG